jgi:hypothetical protein
VPTIHFLEQFGILYVQKFVWLQNFDNFALTLEDLISFLLSLPFFGGSRVAQQHSGGWLPVASVLVFSRYKYGAGAWLELWTHDTGVVRPKTSKTGSGREGGREVLLHK